MKAFINALIPYLVVLAQVLLVCAVLFHKNKVFRSWLKKNAMAIIFTFSLLATMGSLFYSLIMGYAPCDLCWYQRILMYPLVIISGFSLAKSSKRIKKIILTMASIGAGFAIYHYVTQLIAASSPFCTVGATDCVTKAIFKFGYISIPLMAFTAFAIIIFTTLLFVKKS